MTYFVKFRWLNDHLFGKGLYIRFIASAFHKLMSVYVFSYFPFYFEGRMWDLIVSVPDHCLAFYFELLICVVEFIVSRTSITLCIIFIAIFSSKLTSKLTLVTEVLEFLTKNVCCLKVSKTSNAQDDCRIDHRSRAGLRAV